MLIFKNDK